MSTAEALEHDERTPRLQAIIVEDDLADVSIPGWVVDLPSFRRWARSSDFPECGRIDFINGTIWVDMSMEELLTHNLVKGVFTVVLGNIVMTADLGYLFLDRMRISNPDADLSAEPDIAFASYETLRTGRLRKKRSRKGGIVELEGSPDMALEIVSDRSVRKDTTVLPHLYARSGITESWLVDVRKQALRFDIYRLHGEEYRKVRSADGWLRSKVFGKEFRLVRYADRLGEPRYTLEVR